MSRVWFCSFVHCGEHKLAGTASQDLVSITKESERFIPVRPNQPGSPAVTAYARDSNSSSPRRVYSIDMPISEPEQKPSDLLQAVGFREVDAKSGTISRVLGISEEGFRSVAALGKKGSPLWQAAQEDRVTKHLIKFIRSI
jgi:hypothetical protein